MKKRCTFFMIGFVLLFITILKMPVRASEEFIFPCYLEIDGRQYKPEIRDDVYTFLLPNEVNTASVCIKWSDSLWTLKFEESIINSGDNINLSEGECTLNLIYNGSEMAVKIVVMKSSETIPSLYLNMTDEDNDFIHEDKGNEAKVTTDVINVEEELGMTQVPAEIKGRGNVSWTRAKKSYQIKYDEKQDLLGMGKAKKWILLPSSYDLSMVRNAVAFELAYRIGMEYTPDYRYVDLYMAGRYYGVYIICEKPEMKKNRIDVDSVDDNIENVLGKDVMLSDVEVVFNNEDYSTAVVGDKRIDLTGGYNLEFDNYHESRYQFYTDKNCRVTINEPEMISNGKDVYENDAYRYIREFMQKAEDAVYGYDEQELLKYIDIESFAQMYIMKDFTAEGDANRNMHIWKESDIMGDGLLHAGPAWDYDCSMDRDNLSVQKIDWQVVTMGSDGSGKWLGDLLNHKVFRDELIRLYELHKDLFTTVKVDNVKTSPLRELALEIAATYADSSKMDTVRWTGTEDFCKKQDFTDADREASLNVVTSFVLNRNDYFAKRIEQISKMVSPSAPSPRPTESPKPTNTPQPAKTPEVEEIPETADNLIQLPSPLVTPSTDLVMPTVKPDKRVKKGEVIKDKKKIAFYKVMAVKGDKIEVTLQKLLKKNVKKYRLPKNVTLANGKKAKVVAISKNAFKNCKKLKMIVVGKSIKRIGGKNINKIKKLGKVKIKTT